MLIRFFLIAFALCWLITIPIALHVQGLIQVELLPSRAQWLIGVIPIIAAAWVTRGSADRSAWLADALRTNVPSMWYAIAALLPWAMLGGALGVRMLLGKELPHMGADPATLAIFGALWLVLAFGEEAGWRAYALPRMLSASGFLGAATLLGVLWCVWHYPKLYASPYLHLDALSLKGVAQFSLQIIVANYVLCWLFVRTRSAVVTSLFHGSFNLVATVHALAAIDPTLTLVMALTALAILVVDRDSVRSARVSVLQE
jgi:membrane protease YdiL (CAAX protease family)